MRGSIVHSFATAPAAAVQSLLRIPTAELIAYFFNLIWYILPAQRLAAPMLIQVRFTIENESDEIDTETLERIKSTMTGVRDPAFWRRFSMAVHMDEEKGVTRSMSNIEKIEAPKEPVMVQHT